MSFPNLQRLYPYRNVELLVKTLEKYYGFLFDLKRLDALASSMFSREDFIALGGYTRGFDWFMNVKELRMQLCDETTYSSRDDRRKVWKNQAESAASIGDQCTVSDLLRIWNQNLQVAMCLPKIETYLGLMFVPPAVDGTPVTQLGYLEKIITGTARPQEPLTHLDMLRALSALAEYERKQECRYMVTSLAILEQLSEYRVEMCREYDVVVLNINKDPHGIPKWAVYKKEVKYTKYLGYGVSNPVFKPHTVFCEMTLSGAEQQALQRVFGETIPEFITRGTDNLLSTGYAVLTDLVGYGNLPDADFPIDLQVCLTLQCQSYYSTSGSHLGASLEKSRHYLIFSEQDKVVCHPFFQAQIKHATGAYGEPKQGQFLSVKESMLSIVRKSALGTAYGQHFEPGDLGAVVRSLPVVAEISAAASACPEDISFMESVYQRMKSSLSIHWPYKIRVYEGEKSSRYSMQDYTSWLDLFEEKREQSLIRFNFSESVQKSRDSLTSREYQMTLGMLYKALESSGTPGEIQRIVETTWPWSDAVAGAAPVTPIDRLLSLCCLWLLRAHAKKRQIHIVLSPNLRFSDELREILIHLILASPYIVNLTLEGHASLLSIRPAVGATLARNRWLQLSQYRIPLIDDYWKQAARRWLLYLLQSKSAVIENAQFKDCVLEMGLRGMQEVLQYLRCYSDSIAEAYQGQSPCFYAASSAAEMEESLLLLTDYLQQQAHYFPYSRFEILYQQGHDVRFVQLLSQLNQREGMKECIVALSAEQSVLSLLPLLRRVFTAVTAEHWTCRIVIPSLEQLTYGDERLQELLSLYYAINNAIHHHQQQQHVARYLQRLQEDHPLPTVTATSEEAVAADRDEILFSVADAWDMHWEDSLQLKFPLPLHRAGSRQIQVQQQQQIQQVIQVQRQQVLYIEPPAVDGMVIGELVTYKTVEKLLKKDYQALGLDLTSFAPLKTDRETPLQGLFHTWISANPAVAATDIIYGMTQDAAKFLLKHYRDLISGLYLDNLPLGFYTQRSKDDQLILCYDPNFIDYNRNALTLDFTTVLATEQQPWVEDYRILPVAWGSEQERMQWYAQLQPSGYRGAEFDKFCQGYARVLSGFPSAHMDLIRQNWTLVYQYWLQGGIAAVQRLLQDDPNTWQLEPRRMAAMLLQDVSSEIQAWFVTQGFNQDSTVIRAFGQVYLRYGHEGLALILQRFMLLQNVQGADFLQQFLGVMANNFHGEDWLSSAFLTMIDEMIKTNPLQLQIWQRLLTIHLSSISKAELEKLWFGFSLFMKELKSRGIELPVHVFDGVVLENMFTLMNRMLAILKGLPPGRARNFCLEHFSRLDRTEGGVLYALKQGFRHIEDVLGLSDFIGDETYVPNMQKIYVRGSSWDNALVQRNFLRVLASHPRFDEELHEKIIGWVDRIFAQHPNVIKQLLIILVHTQYANEDLDLLLPRLLEQPKNTARLATHLYNAVYQQGYHNPVVNLPVILDVFAAHSEDLDTIEPVLQEQGTGVGDTRSKPVLKDVIPVFEVISMLTQCGTSFDVKQLLSLFSENIRRSSTTSSSRYSRDKAEVAPISSDWARNIYKVAVLLRKNTALAEFYGAIEGGLTSTLRAKRQALQRVMQQLLSIKLRRENLVRLQQPAVWKVMITWLRSEPAQLLDSAVKFIYQLRDQFGIEFTSLDLDEVDGAGVRKLSGLQELPVLGAFVEHEERLAQFFLKHLAVPVGIDAKKSLEPIVNFLHVLQLNDAYINEIEPLLTAFAATPADHYWSSRYFYSMLSALQPPEVKSSFPSAVLEVLLQDEALQAKPLWGVEHHFPEVVRESLHAILTGVVSLRRNQVLLCRFALWEFHQKKANAWLMQALNTCQLLPDHAVHTAFLDFLLTATTEREAETYLAHGRCLLQYASLLERAECDAHKFSEVLRWWLLALKQDKTGVVQSVFQDLQRFEIDKQYMLLRILALSTVNHNTTDFTVWQRKAKKLVDRLAMLDKGDLRSIAAVYSMKPAPMLEALLQLLKHKPPAQSWTIALNTALCNPNPSPKPDYAHMAITRDEDIQRMITETQIGMDGQRYPFTLDQIAKIMKIFSYIKDFERGAKLRCGQALLELNQQELAAQFHVLSQTKPQDDQTLAELCALLFTALGRSTGKYPHLAQQFAFIANVLCIDSPMRALKLATGEGKSHFIAMQAAIHAAQGRSVDVCTVKASLALRDQQDYEDFFRYLGFRSAYIDATTERTIFDESHIHFSTMGDISLFEDAQADKGQPLQQPTEKRVLLLDEFDHILFNDDTQFNYAQSLSTTPKKMAWFYRAVNAYYQRIVANGTLNLMAPCPIDQTILDEFYRFLQQQAGRNAGRQMVLERTIKKQRMHLLQWLQSAHEAATSCLGKDFTVAREDVVIGQEINPMRIIIPLNTSKQRAYGATFGSGVQQLLAAHLNMQEKQAGRPQNYYAPPESSIVSSQIAEERMRTHYAMVEGYTGTISAAQAKKLSQGYGFQVLHVPTNRRNLRKLHPPVITPLPTGASRALSKLNLLDLEELQKTLPGSFERVHTATMDTIATLSFTAAEVAAMVAALAENQAHLKEKLEFAKYAPMLEKIKACLAAKQSLLISCQDDRQVLWLQQILAQDLQDQSLFYTNEDSRSPSEILQYKRQLEAWQEDGQKQRGVALFAACFERGDNVEVDAVMVINMTDPNNFDQTIGRTARNGAPGDVYQFYIAEDLEKEHRALLEYLDAAGIPAPSFATETGDRLEQLRALREYVTEYRLRTHRIHQSLIAQYSTWSMQLAGQIADDKQRQDFVQAIVEQLKSFDKRWRAISGQEMWESEKITEIQAVILRDSASLLADARGVLSDSTIPPFEFRKRSEPAIECLLLPIPEIQEQVRQFAMVCNVVIRMSVQHPDYKELFNARLAELAQQPQKIAAIAAKIAALTDPDSVLQLLQSDVVVVSECAVQSNLERLIRHYHPAHESDSTLLAVLEQAVAKQSEQGLRALTVWEAWVSDVPLTSAYAFLQDFAAVMRVIEPTQAEMLWLWDQLLKRMQQWIHKGQQRSYREGLFALWKGLGTHHQTLTTIRRPTVEFYLKQSGKSWFEALSLQLQLCDQQERDHGAQMCALWQSLQQLKKRQRTTVFASCIAGLQKFYQVPGSQALTGTLQNFKNSSRLACFLQWLDRQLGADGVVPNVQLLAVILDYFADVSISLDYADAMSSFLTDMDRDYPGCLGSLVPLVKSLQQTLVAIPDELPQCFSGIRRFYQVIPDYSNVKALQDFSDQSRTVAFLKWLAALSAEQLQLLRAYPRLLPDILNYFSDTAVSLARAGSVGNFLITLSKTHPQGLERVLPRIHALKTMWCQLSERRFNVWLTTLGVYRADIIQYPQLIDFFAELCAVAEISDEQLQLLSEALVLAIRNNHDVFDGAEVMQGLRLFVGKSSSVLRGLITRLQTYPQDTMSMLYDASQTYLDVQEPRYRQLKQERIHEFYKVAAQGSGVVAQMYTQNFGPTLFADFTQHRVERVYLMRSLYHQALITHPTAAHHAFSWTEAQNTTLLERGFQAYVDDTRRLLADPAEPRFRDLGVGQQRRLLLLCDELRCIGDPQPQFLGQPMALQQGLTQKLSEYRGSWFRSAGRRRQSHDLSTTLDQLFGDQTGYAAVLQTLIQAKMTAVQDDRDCDRSRLWFLKMNRGGRSRYYETLTQMEDLVIRAWAQDQTAIHSFEQYQQKDRQQLEDLMQRLQQRIEEESLRSAAPLGRALAAVQAEMNRDNLMTVLGLLQQPKILPGHLCPLAHEIFTRGEAWGAYLQEREPRLVAAL